MPTTFDDGWIDFDHALFAKINHDWTNSFFDWLFPAVTDLHKNPYSLFVVLPLLAYWFWRCRTHAVKWFMVAVVSVSLADAIAYRVIKAEVQRARPQMAGVQVELRTHRHEGTSFPSNHASNIFAAATALSFGVPVLTPVFFLLAFLVGYSRIYNGVHFPLDVLAGALLGISVALIVRRIFKRWLYRSIPKDERDADSLALANSIVRSDAREKG